ncbi:MAG: diaminopimelate decarboxylase [Bacteroidetes bacterium]|nr:MAG: diaminopimelate decarboxylase [Bacteroidota bacterium]
MFSKEIIEQFQNIETPFYYYDTDLLAQTLQAVKSESEKYGFTVHYALKANVNDQILRQIHNFGFGADCVSGNEVKKALEIGFKPDHVVFAGVGKSDKEIMEALQADIFCFNSESVQELEVINELAIKLQKTAKIALRINPNVQADTHKYITTGTSENKFGINLHELDSVIDNFANYSNLKLIGLHFHIGSQILDLNNFKDLALKINEIQDNLEKKGVVLENINVGGGLGIDYKNPDENLISNFKDYFKNFAELLKIRKHQKVHFELGRALVAQCGSLISKVLYLKKGVSKQFLIIDAGMTELIRPALYQAHHHIQNLTSDKIAQNYDVVGPICESSDCFGKEISLNEAQRGDLIAIRSAGAYGEVMTSFYNLRDKAKAIYKNELLN